ncbi:unnamed protein product (macronuclear) [Paramecium tetraurelia]|uniref:C3H1-type domain-containing protein n=1 Tax=Paramecium tetraurelia TaxID=5888 RepID=A0CZU8_PARTE|nr:uncharacterized protein GSPATT00011888001 [Paramecium tetraurelia]CAK76315.1 unnamed protein product [Paramecium tetraurelia]|eukprot:XP_001443712.1 hypothetical protein (macronuclear) [Paramecium tetraurelia strain d4-2]
MSDVSKLRTYKQRTSVQQKTQKLNSERRSLNTDLNNYLPKQPTWTQKCIKNAKRCSINDSNEQDKRGSMSTVATLTTMSTDFQVQDDDPIEEMSSSSDESQHKMKFKTEMCKNWSLVGKCNYSNKCQFAHGENEKMSRQSNTKYKSKLCRSFHQEYVCFYGARCQFIHESRSVEQIKRDYKSQTVFYQPSSLQFRLKSLQSITSDWKQQIPLQECLKLWMTKLLIQINLSSSSE